MKNANPPRVYSTNAVVIHDAAIINNTKENRDTCQLASSLSKQYCDNRPTLIDLQN